MFIIIILLILILPVFIYLVFKKSSYSLDLIHPYTNAPSNIIFIDFYRFFFIIFISIYISIIHFSVGIILFMFCLIYGLFTMNLWKKIYKNPIIFSIEYTEEEQIEARQLFQKRPTCLLVETNKIVFNSFYFFTSMRKKYTTEKKKYDNFVLEQVTYENSFLILKYFFSQFPAKQYYIYIPSRYRQNCLHYLQTLDPTLIKNSNTKTKEIWLNKSKSKKK